jgi:hypothetical protein
MVSWDVPTELHGLTSRYLSTNLHGVTSQEAVILILTAMILNLKQNSSFFFFFKGSQACSDLTCTFLLSEDLPRSRRPFGLYRRICFSILSSVILSGCFIQFCPCPSVSVCADCIFSSPNIAILNTI